MGDNMYEILKILTENNKTISTMESCTGGYLANCITNNDGSSDIFKFGAVTYSNEYKIKMGVSKKIINKYTVYSLETAKEMARAISCFTNSNYGIGITGQLHLDDGIIYFSIYNKDTKEYYNQSLSIGPKSREEKKEIIVSIIMNKLKEIL